MAIIVFNSNEKKETGQTLTTAALATYMSIEHNQKMLIVSTDFNDGASTTANGEKTTGVPVCRTPHRKP